MSIRAKLLLWRVQPGEDVAEDLGEADFRACPRKGETVRLADGEERTVIGVTHLVADKRHNVEVHF